MHPLGATLPEVGGEERGWLGFLTHKPWQLSPSVSDSTYVLPLMPTLPHSL